MSDQTATATSWAPLAGRLLPRLADEVPEWAVLKNAERLPEVSGDVDLLAPRAAWAGFVRAYLRALGELGEFAVVTCDHYPGVRLTFAVALDDSLPQALEIDLADGIWWKGTRLRAAADLLALARPDGRGFRVLPSGVEAAYQVTVNALDARGRLLPRVVEAKAVRAKALADPDGFVRVMTALHGAAGAWAARGFLDGAWPAAAGPALAGRRLVRGLRTPLVRPAGMLTRRAGGHWRGLPRQLDGTAAAWLDRVAPGHPCHRAGGRS